MTGLTEEINELAQKKGPTTMEDATKIMDVLLHLKIKEIMTPPCVKETGDWYSEFLMSQYQALLTSQPDEDQAKRASDLMGAVVQLSALGTEIQQYLTENLPGHSLPGKGLSQEIKNRTKDFSALLTKEFNAIIFPSQPAPAQETLRDLLQAQLVRQTRLQLA